LHKKIRDTVGIRPGDILDEQVEDGKIILTRSKKPSESLRGIAKKTKAALGMNATELVRSLRTEDEEEF